VTIPFTLTNESITVIYGGKNHVTQKGSPQFAGLRQALITENWADVPNHLTIAKSLQEWAKGKFTIEGETVFYNKERLPSDINARIIAMASKNEDPTPLFNFYERLQKNPSFRSVQQLYGFLQHSGIPLTPDGCFLAYKSVKYDYKDVHSSTFDNSPGKTNEMPRNKISDDPDLACHDGFHVGALSYAQTFHSGGRIVVCKVDPENVVCVPKDESQRKMRVCKYTIIGNHNGEMLPSTTYVPEENDPTPEDLEESDIDGDDSDGLVAVGDDGDAGAEPIVAAETPTLEESQQAIVDLVATKAGGEPSGEVVPRTFFLNEAHELPPIKKAEKRASKKGFTKFDKMDLKGLMNESIEDLRRYAGKGLQITGASKIPGGKTALVARIIEVRK